MPLNCRNPPRAYEKRVRALPRCRALQYETPKLSTLNTQYSILNPQSSTLRALPRRWALQYWVRSPKVWILIVGGRVDRVSRRHVAPPRQSLRTVLRGLARLHGIGVRLRGAAAGILWSEMCARWILILIRITIRDWFDNGRARDTTQYHFTVVSVSLEYDTIITEFRPIERGDRMRHRIYIYMRHGIYHLCIDHGCHTWCSLPEEQPLSGT